MEGGCCGGNLTGGGGADTVIKRYIHANLWTPFDARDNDGADGAAERARARRVGPDCPGETYHVFPLDLVSVMAKFLVEKRKERGASERRGEEGEGREESVSPVQPAKESIPTAAER